MERVGKLHVHDLPYNGELPVREDVYKCYCGKEFFVEENTETRFGKNNKKWAELDSSSYSVEYEQTVNGETFIGRAGPDTVFDEPKGETNGEQATEAGADAEPTGEPAPASE